MLAVEAALSDKTSEKVLAEVAKLAPGKPVRTLVQTHHHGDHIGGVRTYIAHGATIVTPLGMSPLLRRIVANPSRVAPDALAREPKPLKVEEVAGERVIDDPGNEVRLYDFPSDHSDHMLVVYLPEQQLLYQGDLINAGEIAINATSHRFLKWLRAHRLPVKALAGLHGRTVSGDELDGLIKDERLSAAN